MKNLIKKILKEQDFDWTDDIPSVSLPKDKHWFIFINSKEELEEAEEFIRSHGYSIHGEGEGESYRFSDDEWDQITALEHDPEEGRTVDNLYDGRYVSYLKAKEMYPDAIFYVWSKVKSVLNEDFDWVSNVGRDREQILDDLEARIKLMGWDVDLERESENTSHEGQWYFGRFWCGDEFYELYENNLGEGKHDYSIHRHAKGAGVGWYVFHNSYDNLNSKELMSKITRIIVNCLDGNDINEDFDWIDDVPTSIEPIEGGKYYINYYGFYDEPVLIKVLEVTDSSIVFEVLDERFLKYNEDMFWDGEHWDPTDSLSLDSFIGSDEVFLNREPL